MVDAGLHPADVVADDENNVRLLRGLRVYDRTFAGDADDQDESESTNQGH